MQSLPQTDAVGLIPPHCPPSPGGPISIMTAILEGACPSLGHPNLPLLFAKVPRASQDALGLPRSPSGTGPGLRPHGLKKFLRLNHAGVHINTCPWSSFCAAGTALHMQVRSFSGCSHNIHPSLGSDWSSYWALDFWCPGPMVHTGSLTAG